MPLLTKSPFICSIVLLCGFSAPTFAAPGPAPSPPASAYITKLTGPPQSPDTLYAATNGGGLYRTRDGGDFWENITPDPDLPYLNVVMVDAADSDRIYAGGRDSGLWQSEDAGASWTHAALGQTTILSLVIDPVDPDRYYVLTPDGVHRSIAGLDGPWAHVFDYPAFISKHPDLWPNPEWGARMSRFQHLTLDPHTPGVLYVGGRWEGGYHRSDDGGDTWTHESLGPIFRRADRILPDPHHPRILYAETHHQGMFKSYNHGRSWVSSSHGIAPQKRTPHYGAVLVSGSAFDPAAPDTLYAGSDYSNWKTTDAGETWTELGPSLTCEFARSFFVTAHAVYAGTNVGIYRSFDEGETWEPCNQGLPPREIVATATGTVDGERFEFAIAKGRPAVFRRSLDHATDWVSISWMLYEDATAVRFETGSLVITTPNGERRSLNGGLRWDVPPTVYVDSPIVTPAPPAVQNLVEDPSPHQLPIAIHGAPAPNDSNIEPMYQRPPYVAWAITSPSYPEDGSTPIRTGHWQDKLSGTLSLPASIGELAGKKVLRVEVRDFQYGTRVGSAPLKSNHPVVVEVEP